MHPSTRTTRSTSRAAFTLTELIVAVGAVALLTVGIGQIFKSVGRLTSLGQANAEVDSLARAIERQLRDDLQGLSRLDPSQSFLAVRMREVGDIDRDRLASPVSIDGEAALYIRREDVEADVRDGLDPYEVQSLTTGETLRSRAVTTRLDEIVFLSMAESGRTFESVQPDVPGLATGPASSQVAKIAWSHMLRPIEDPNFDPDDDMPPVRQFIPDGDFGQPRPNVSGDTFDPPGAAGPFEPSGRNQFAGSFLLGRQVLVLYGGGALGGLDASQAGLSPGQAPGGAPLPSPIGASRTVAPYIRDYENLSRSLGALLPSPEDPESDFSAAYFSAPTPAPMALMYGWTDICAQNVDDVRRWLEGEAAPPQTPPAGYFPPFAGAYADGFYSRPEVDLASAVNNPQNAPLWPRDNTFTFGAMPPDPAGLARSNLIGLRSAIAGVFTRMLAEGEPPRIEREPDGAFVFDPAAPVMDLHAVIATRCSRFEVAWSDGTTAARPIDVDNDGEFDYFVGDLIWFDISPILDQSADPPTLIRRNTYEEWRQFDDANSDTVPDGNLNWAGGDSFYNSLLRPRVEVPSGRFAPTAGDIDIGSDFDPNGDLILVETAGFPGAEGLYSPAITGGARDPAADTLADPPNELLAIWGFRLPTGDGGWGQPWSKPRFLRVRTTLHDAQFRIPGGKRFEFVFTLDPERG